MMLTPMAIQQMWERAWPIISLLLGCSILSGAIILERWVSLRRAAFGREALLLKLRKLLSENRREQALAQCETLRKPVGHVLTTLMEFAQANPSADRDQLERLGDRLVRAENSNLMRYLTGLGTIGSVAPFVGLLGTVLGIIEAFRAIAENSGGGPGVVANGISEALITTALGLFVAIPAVVAYNLFLRKVERITQDLELCTEEVADLMSPKR